MTTLNLDLDIAAKAIEKMTEALSNWADNQEKNRSLMMKGLYEAKIWQGASAKNFYDSYGDLHVQINAQLQEYQKLINALSNEVLEWEQRSLHLIPGMEHKYPPLKKVTIGGITVEIPDTKPSGQVIIDGNTIDIP